MSTTVGSPREPRAATPSPPRPPGDREALERLRRSVAAAPVEAVLLADPTGADDLPASVRAVVIPVAACTSGDAVRAIRRLHRTRPDLRIVAVGDAAGEDFAHAFGAGADAWIDQRATPETLAAALVGRIVSPAGPAAKRSRRWWWRGRRRPTP